MSFDTTTNAGMKRTAQLFAKERLAQNRLLPTRTSLRNGLGAVSMPILVQKFGGATLSTSAGIRQVARTVADAFRSGTKVLVVVSGASKNSRDRLESAFQLSSDPRRGEIDLLLAAGDQESVAFLAIAIHELGFPAVTLPGIQFPLKIAAGDFSRHDHSTMIRRLMDALDAGKIVPTRPGGEKTESHQLRRDAGFNFPRRLHS